MKEEEPIFLKVRLSVINQEIYQLAHCYYNGSLKVNIFTFFRLTKRKNATSVPAFLYFKPTT
jgi:hypothetical protein